ncbi:hypothetical protein F383_30733 [Gossypium arboreum]|uniref:Uncharacterized protein n=1 Tax=Gossypium arboreum TaxID=29729 RepID=A0A0B0PJ82_GOSAR|nr:hypothetical protein F383_30733 [Gossypium arboreum]
MFDSMSLCGVFKIRVSDE